MKTGIELIEIERKEQIEKHGRSVYYDLNMNTKYQLSFAAALMSAPDPREYAEAQNNYGCPTGWDVDLWKKMINKGYLSRLVIAGALLAAEIDRLKAMQQAFHESAGDDKEQ